MSQEERTHTDISSLSEISVVGAPRQHPLPWVLFGVASLLIVLIGGLLAKRLNMEVKRANAEIAHSAELETKLKAAEAGRADAEKKATDAETARADAEKTATELNDRVKKLEADKATAVKEEKKAAPPPKKAGKKPKKKKKSR